MTLARAPLERPTVVWVGADGTATAGEDYTATSGTLSFRPGGLCSRPSRRARRRQRRGRRRNLQAGAQQPRGGGHRPRRGGRHLRQRRGKAARPSRPTVSSVRLNSNPGTDNARGIGDVAEFTAAFSQAVTVGRQPPTALLHRRDGKVPCLRQRAGNGIRSLLLCGATRRPGNSCRRGPSPSP